MRVDEVILEWWLGLSNVEKSYLKRLRRETDLTGKVDTNLISYFRLANALKPYSKNKEGFSRTQIFCVMQALGKVKGHKQGTPLASVLKQGNVTEHRFRALLARKDRVRMVEALVNILPILKDTYFDVGQLGSDIIFFGSETTWKWATQFYGTQEVAPQENIEV